MPFGRSIRFRGRVEASSAGCEREVSVLIGRDVAGGNRTFRQVATVQTNSQGTFSFTPNADRNATWAARVTASARCDGHTSDAVPVRVNALVRLAVSDATPPRGARVILTAGLKPCGNRSGQEIKLQKRKGGRIVLVSRKNISRNCTASFTQSAGSESVDYRAVWPKQDPRNEKGKSVIRHVNPG